MEAPATVALDGSVGCLLHADSGHPVTVVPSWVRTLSMQQMWSNSTADASPADGPGSFLVELERPLNSYKPFTHLSEHPTLGHPPHIRGNALLGRLAGSGSSASDS